MPTAVPKRQPFYPFILTFFCLLRSSRSDRVRLYELYRHCEVRSTVSSVGLLTIASVVRIVGRTVGSIFIGPFPADIQILCIGASLQCAAVQYKTVCSIFFRCVIREIQGLGAQLHGEMIGQIAGLIRLDVNNIIRVYY